MKQSLTPRGCAHASLHDGHSDESSKRLQLQALCCRIVLRVLLLSQMRAKHDIYNALYAGCTAGGVLASSGGPKAMCAGCVTFAAFSAFIDRMLDHD